MVKHIVMYNFKEGTDKKAAVDLIASVLEPLVGKIPGLLHMEIRGTFTGMDYVLYVEKKTVRRMRIRAFRKMIYENHFDKNYLELEEKKKELETRIAKCLEAFDFE